MLGNPKELIVVLAIASMVFYLAKPIALQFASAEQFATRRLVWFVLTVMGFASPNFWIYVLVAVPTLVWACRKDSNPIAIYLFLLHVVPPVGVVIPLLGNNGLFDLDNYKLMAFCVLIPAVMQERKSRAKSVPRLFGAMDVLLLGYGVLVVALYLPPDLPHHLVLADSSTNALRRAVLFMLDTYLPYYAVSRLCLSREKLVDAIASFCLACGIMAAVAMFENIKGWLLYLNIVSRWGTESRAAFYLMRDGVVRAQASAGHALALGYLLAVASGLWLYLKSRLPRQAHRIEGTALIWGGLVAAFSRGPWLGAVVIYIAFNLTSPRPLSRLMKGAGAALAIGAVVALTPLGDRILDVLPVMGQTADANILYRQRLAERGWELVFASPLFGDQFPFPKMEDLRQGEGIIDIVNTYLGVALNYGLVGLFCFVGFILLAMTRAYVRLREVMRIDPDLALIGSGLIAAIAGTMVMIQSASFNLGYQKLFYVLAALAVAYASLDRTLPQNSAPRPASVV